GANGAAISGHTTNCKVEIKDTIVHDCSQGFAVSSRGGRYDLSGVRFSDITGYCIIALTGTDKTNVVDIDQCLFDNVGKLCSSLWDGAHTPVTITNSVFRNITSSEQSTGFSGAGNEWDVAIPNLAGNVRTFTAATDLSVHGTNIEQFRGYDSLHPWHPDSTQTSAPNHFILPLDFEVHTFDTGREINTVGQRIISTPGSHGLPRANGHFRFLGNLTGPTRYALLEDNLRSWISDYPYNTSSGTGFRGFKIRTRWKNIEKTEGNINGGDVAYLESLYQICDDAGVYLMNNLLDISFGGSDYTDSHAPQYIEDGGGTDIKYFSDESQRQSGGTTAHVMLYVAQWMDKYIAMLKNYHDHFNKYNSYLGIEMPETSRSSQKTPGGNISAAFYDQYSRCLEEVGAHFMTGPKNAYLNAHINFQVAGGHDYVEDYFPRFVNQAGIEIGTPDFNWAWYIKNPNHASKTIKAYDLMRQYGDRMLIAPSRETRDSPLDPVDDFKMMFDIGANSIRPHRVYHYTEWWVVKGSSPADIRTAEYRRNVLNLLEQSDWKYNHDVPSNEAGGASTYEGKNPTYTDVGFTGTALNLKNRTNATASVTDEFTVEFKDALDVDETQTVEFSELPAVQGTQTDKAFSYVSLNSSHITENGTPSWLPDTTVGYTGTHALRADGDNKTSGATTYENGDFIRIDASQLVGVNRLYMRVKSTDGTNNEWWAKFQAGSIPWGSDQYIPPALRGDYIWKELLDPLDNSTTRTVSASDGYIDLYVREDGLLLDGYVFVHESETSAPTGLEGYISNNVEQNSTIIGDTDYNLQKGQSVNVKWELSVEQGSEYDSIAVDTIDQNGTVVPFTSNVVTTSLGGNKFRISADITGQEIGSYRARFTAIVNGFELIDIVQVWVEEVSQSNFPSGITVDMDTEKTVAVGSTYTIDTQIQNTPNYNI
ncbi:MAG: hypothetical protein GY938_07160, partial [Ketobacter sp.]|nr:hypothetical protein [Ketobacter sp.]